MTQSLSYRAFLKVFFVVVLYFGIVSIAYASLCGNCSSSCGGQGGNPGLGNSTHNPQPPRPCTITISQSIVASGTPSVTLSWTPQPDGKVTLKRAKTSLSVPNDATTYTDSIASLKSGTYSYGVSYRSGGSISFHGGGFGGSRNDSSMPGGNVRDYACAVTLTIVDKVVECNDGKDNADSEDSFADALDPGCHTDGNPNNAKSYVPLDESEVNPPSDMVPSITTATRSKAKRPVAVTAAAQNVSSIAAVVNSLVFGWRNTSTSAPAPTCGRASSGYPAGSRCFVQGGKTYLILGTYNQSYLGSQKRNAPTRSFRPLEAGRYEVCAVADYANTVYEGVTGERNNSTCVPLIVDPEDPSAPPTPGPTITGAVELIVAPGRVRKGTETSVTWDTGGREQCVITGTNGHIIDLTGSDSAGSEATPPITSETSYTMECADDGATAEGKVGIIPIIQEI